MATETKCIYCKRPTSSTNWSVEHVIPKSICGTDKLVLPPEYVHEQCNNALRDLDDAVLNHGPVMSRATFSGNTTRSGQPRTRIGNKRNYFEALDQDRWFAQSTVTLPAGKYPAHQDLAVFTGAGPEFDEWKMNRGLHKIALCTLTYQFLRWGQGDRIFDPEFDALRNYVRNPRSRDEAWIWGTRLGPDRRTAVLCVRSVGEWFVVARLLGVDFVMSTHNRLLVFLPSIESRTLGEPFATFDRPGYWRPTGRSAG